MTKKIQPMLAKKAEYDKIKYPVLATPKLDGIRCLMVDGKAMSRTMKPIPNKFIQDKLKDLHGMDGELMVKGGFNEVSSGIMNSNGEPDFEYYVFDCYTSGAGYQLRIKDLEEAFQELHWVVDEDVVSRVKILKPVEITCEESLEAYLEECLSKGYEGIMIRQPCSPYKYGRSTVKEGYLLKVKRFLDSEGTLVDVIEGMTNTNEQQRDELGKSKRSSAKDGLVPAGIAGSVTITWNGVTFNCGFGPGIDTSNKKEILDNKDSLIGQLVKFSYQELTADGIPRFAKMLSVRHPDDM